jgi:hypothetical protein
MQILFPKILYCTLLSWIYITWNVAVALIYSLRCDHGTHWRLLVFGECSQDPTGINLWDQQRDECGNIFGIGVVSTNMGELRILIFKYSVMHLGKKRTYRRSGRTWPWSSNPGWGHFYRNVIIWYDQNVKVVMQWVCQWPTKKPVAPRPNRMRSQAFKFQGLWHVLIEPGLARNGSKKGSISLCGQKPWILADSEAPYVNNA